MQRESVRVTEETLDPVDWDRLKRLGHRMLADMFDYLQNVRERPVWQPTPDATKKYLQQDLPEFPQESEDIYQEFSEHILPYTKGNIHPRFWGWVEGNGTATGMLADMLASGMNPNTCIGDHADMYVDGQVLDWCKQIFGFPKSATGLLTSGATIANITALIVARNQVSDNLRKQGLRTVNGQLITYASTESHSCVQKAMEVIGVGSDNMRRVPVDELYRIRIDILSDLIEKDVAAGFIPFCIIGNAGSVNTGSIDDLDGLLAIAGKYRCWFHVDGAFGAAAKLLPAFDMQLKAIEKADSLAFDFHKWFYVNYEVGCVLVRNGDAHRKAFSVSPNYLLSHERGLAAGPEPTSNFSMELGRGFKALKIWMMIKEHGIEKFRRLIRQNLVQTKYLVELIKQKPSLELLAPVPLNIVCYRYNPGTLNAEELNALNKELLMRLQESGLAAPSCTLLNGQYAIRVANTNHRSRLADFDVLVNETIRIGEQTQGNYGK